MYHFSRYHVSRFYFVYIRYFLVADTYLIKLIIIKKMQIFLLHSKLLCTIYEPFIPDTLIYEYMLNTLGNISITHFVKRGGGSE